MFVTASVPEWTLKKKDEGPVAGDFKTEEQPVENLKSPVVIIRLIITAVVLSSLTLTDTSS